MRCNPELVSAYYDGLLALDERERVAEHVSRCPQCAADLDSYRVLSARLHRLPVSAVPASLDRALLTALLQLGQPAKLHRFRWLSNVAGLAAMLFMTFGLSFLILNNQLLAEAEVLTSSPVNVAKDVPVDGPIPIVFSRAVNRQAVQQSTRIEPFAELAYEWQDRSVVVRPKAELQAGTVYRVVVAPVGEGAKPRPAPTPVISFRTSQSQSKAASASPSPRPGSSALRSKESGEAVEQRETGLTSGPKIVAAKSQASWGRPHQLEEDIGRWRKEIEMPVIATPRPAPLVSAAMTAPADSQAATTEVARPTALPVALPLTSIANVGGTADCSPSFNAVQLGHFYQQNETIRRRLGCAIGREQPVLVVVRAHGHDRVVKTADNKVAYWLPKEGKWSHTEEMRDKRNKQEDTTEYSARRTLTVRSASEEQPPSSGIVAEFQHGTILLVDRLTIYVLFSDGQWQDFPARKMPRESP